MITAEISKIFQCRLFSVHTIIRTKRYEAVDICFKYFDHFGLEESDHIWAPGFCDWYTLQHYDRFNKAYKPFITYIEFDEPFSGTY